MGASLLGAGLQALAAPCCAVPRWTLRWLLLVPLLGLLPLTGSPAQLPALHQVRVGIFSLRDIMPGEELTYDYQVGLGEQGRGWGLLLHRDLRCCPQTTACMKRCAVEQAVNECVLTAGRVSQHHLPPLFFPPRSSSTLAWRRRRAPTAASAARPTAGAPWTRSRSARG